MDRTLSPTGPRLSALAAALFAITLNFLQPLVHAALMRDGAPRAMWSMFCNTPDGSAETAGQQTPDTASKAAHGCCLGLAHAAPITVPPSLFVVLPPPVAVLPSSLPDERSPAIAIRDGPRRLRGPPSFV